jgi:hypothetical protein
VSHDFFAQQFFRGLFHSCNYTIPHVVLFKSSLNTFHSLMLRGGFLFFRTKQ